MINYRNGNSCLFLNLIMDRVIFSIWSFNIWNKITKSLKSITFCCSGCYNCKLKSKCSNNICKPISRLLFPIRLFYPISPIIAENINRLQVNLIVEFAVELFLDFGLDGTCKHQLTTRSKTFAAVLLSWCRQYVQYAFV